MLNDIFLDFLCCASKLRGVLLVRIEEKLLNLLNNPNYVQFYGECICYFIKACRGITD